MGLNTALSVGGSGPPGSVRPSPEAAGPLTTLITDSVNTGNTC